MAQERLEERPPPSQIVGANVYRFRVLRVPKWSQERLASEAGLDISTVQNIESGRDPTKKANSPQLDTLAAIADALGVDLARLFEWPTPSYRAERRDRLTALDGGRRSSDPRPVDRPLVVSLPP